MIGIGIGALSAAPSSVLRSFQVQADLTTGLVALPSFMSIACATSGRTTQTSANTLVTVAANAARARNVGSGTGLSVEKATQNAIKGSADFSNGNWTKDAATLDNVAVTQPDGSIQTGLNQVNLTACAAADGPYQLAGLGAVQCNFSVWAKQAGAVCTIRLSDSELATMNVPMVLTTSWVRYDGPAPVFNGASIWLRKVSGSNIGQVAFAMNELGLYPTSYFPNPSALPSQKAADVLSVPSAPLIAPDGFFDLDFTIAPNYADTEFVNDHNLIYFDASNRVYLQQSTKKIILRIGGANILSSALTWSREAAIRIRTQHTVTGRRLVVSGAATGNGDTGLQSASAAISLPATAYLLGSNTGAEECADLRQFTVHRP